MGDNNANEPTLYYALPECYDPITSMLDFEQWVRKYQACAKANKWSDEDKLRHLPPLLKGDAWIIYDELDEEEKDTLEKLVDNLTKKLTVATQIQCGEQLHQRVFDYGNETLLTYQNDVKRLAHRAYPDMQDAQLKPIVLMAFIRGLRGHSVSLARKVRNANPKTFDQALQKAQFIMSDPFIDEAERSDQEALRHELIAINDIDQLRAQAPGQEEYHQSQEPTVSSLTSSPSASLPDASRDSSSSSPEWVDKIVNAIKKIEQKCDYCGKWGHLESDCFKKRRDRKAQATARASSNGESGQRFRREYPRTVGATCGYCLKRNHTEEQCQTKRRALELKGHPVSDDAIMRPNEVNAVSLETSQGNRIPLLV